MLVQEKVCINEGGGRVLIRKDQYLVDGSINKRHTDPLDERATINFLFDGDNGQPETVPVLYRDEVTFKHEEQNGGGTYTTL